MRAITLFSVTNELLDYRQELQAAVARGHIYTPTHDARQTSRRTFETSVPLVTQYYQPPTHTAVVVAAAVAVVVVVAVAAIPSFVSLLFLD